MFNELFTTPCSPVFAGIALGFIDFIKPRQQILKPVGEGIGDNLTVRIDMKCRHQISNTLLYHLSTSVFVDENWCSSGLTLSELIITSGSSESLESGESNWTFFFLIALSSEGVEDTEDPTPERKLELFSSIDELRSYPLRLLARRSAILSSSKMSSSSSG